MIASTFKDSEGYNLKFDEKCPDSDKKYFMAQYPKVDSVAEKKLHCTTCDLHIGTAPISEKIIRTHQVLDVTQCNKCYGFYNSGEFGKGEDGSEYYCRWCGQGGEVFCCSSCPFVFCNKCIKSNLSSAYVKEIEDNDDWFCFVCNKDVLKDHRASHWALKNFMSKQLDKIQKSNVESEEELNNLLNDDLSTCCPKKRKTFTKPTPAPVKRPSAGFVGAQPPQKKPNIPDARPQRVIRSNSSNRLGLPQTRMNPSQSHPKPTTSSRNKGIVCTPDILNMFSNGDEPSARAPARSVANPGVSAAIPPPLVMRANPRNPIPIAPSPLFHNVSGFQVDLNHASRQEIFRLPNGKLIQVRKQTQLPPPSLGFRGPPPRPQFSIRQGAPVQPPRMVRVGAMTSVRVRSSLAQQNQRNVLDAMRAHQNRQQQNILPAAPQVPAYQQPQTTTFAQQNGSISVSRATQPNTPFGAAKTEFEDKMISGMEICQHTINKMITLSNSTSFKTLHNFSDIKELYIHLQYLFTYTSGKLKTLQESLTTGLEGLAKFDEPKECNDDELKIVEEKTDVVEVFSDDEEPIVKPKEEVPENPTIKKPILKHIQYIPKDKPDVPVAAAVQESEVAPSTITESEIVIDEISEETNVQIMAADDPLVAGDKKLKNKVVVKVEKLEDSKNPVIKQFLRKLMEKVECGSESSREATPDFCPELLVNVSIEMNDDEEIENVDLINDEENESIQGINASSTNPVLAASPVILEEIPDDAVTVLSTLTTSTKENETSDDLVETSIETIQLFDDTIASNKESSIIEKPAKEAAKTDDPDTSIETIQVLDDSNATDDNVDETPNNDESNDLPEKELKSSKEIENNIVEIGSAPPAKLLDTDSELIVDSQSTELNESIEDISDEPKEISDEPTEISDEPTEISDGPKEENSDEPKEENSESVLETVCDNKTEETKSTDVDIEPAKCNDDPKVNGTMHEEDDVLSEKDPLEDDNEKETDFWSNKALESTNTATVALEIPENISDLQVSDVNRNDENDIDSFDSLLMSKIDDQERQMEID